LNRLSRAHERYRQTDDRQTTDRQRDGRAIAYSEREREFTFAKNQHNDLLCAHPSTKKKDVATKRLRDVQPLMASVIESQMVDITRA